MPKLSDIVEFIRLQGYGNSVTVAEEFDLPLDKAYRAIEACRRSGLLVDTTRSWVVIPETPGVPVDAGKVSKVARHDYEMSGIERLREFMGLHPGEAFTVKDVQEILEITNSRARAQLKYMADQGELIARAATTGGLYGKPPIIYGTTIEGIRQRNEAVVAKKRSKKKAKTVPKVDEDTDAIERRRLDYLENKVDPTKLTAKAREELKQALIDGGYHFDYEEDGDWWS